MSSPGKQPARIAARRQTKHPVAGLRQAQSCWFNKVPTYPNCWNLVFGQKDGARRIRENGEQRAGHRESGAEGVDGRMRRSGERERERERGALKRSDCTSRPNQHHDDVAPAESRAMIGRSLHSATHAPSPSVHLQSLQSSSVHPKPDGVGGWGWLDASRWLWHPPPYHPPSFLPKLPPTQPPTLRTPCVPTRTVPIPIPKLPHLPLSLSLSLSLSLFRSLFSPFSPFPSCTAVNRVYPLAVAQPFNQTDWNIPWIQKKRTTTSYPRLSLRSVSLFFPTLILSHFLSGSTFSFAFTPHSLGRSLVLPLFRVSLSFSLLHQLSLPPSIHGCAIRPSLSHRPSRFFLGWLPLLATPTASLMSMLLSRHSAPECYFSQFG